MSFTRTDAPRSMLISSKRDGDVQKVKKMSFPCLTRESLFTRDCRFKTDNDKNNADKTNQLCGGRMVFDGFKISFQLFVADCDS